MIKTNSSSKIYKGLNILNNMGDLLIRGETDKAGKLKYAIQTNLNPLVVIGILYKVITEECKKMPLKERKNEKRI